MAADGTRSTDNKEGRTNRNGEGDVRKPEAGRANDGAATNRATAEAERPNGAAVEANRAGVPAGVKANRDAGRTNSDVGKTNAAAAGVAVAANETKVAVKTAGPSRISMVAVRKASSAPFNRPPPASRVAKRRCAKSEGSVTKRGASKAAAMSNAVVAKAE